MKNTFLRKGIGKQTGGVTPCSSTGRMKMQFIKKSWTEPFGCFMLMISLSTGFIGTIVICSISCPIIVFIGFLSRIAKWKKYMKIRRCPVFLLFPTMRFCLPSPTLKTKEKTAKQTRQNLRIILFIMRERTLNGLYIQKKSAWIPLAAVLQEAQERSTRSPPNKKVHPAS